MNLHEAARLARKLIAEHLPAGDWRFKWMRRNATTTLGQCCEDRHGKWVKLNPNYVRNNDEALVLDTILHEIAHAQAGIRAGHGPAWKTKCVALGAKPKACKGREVQGVKRRRVAKSWSAQCPDCGKWIRRSRAPRGTRRGTGGRCLQVETTFVHRGCRRNLTFFHDDA